MAKARKTSVDVRYEDDPELVISRHFDAVAEKGLWEDFTDEEAAVLELFQQQWRVGPGDRVLEPGCGAGRLTQRLAEMVGPNGHVLACDISPGFVERAIGRGLPPQVDVWCCSAAETPLPDHSIDRVICLNAFPHFVDHEAAVAEFRRVLRPRGLLFVQHLASRREINARHRRAGPPLDRHLVPEIDALVDLLSRQGLHVYDAADTSTCYSVAATAR